MFNKIATQISKVKSHITSGQWNHFLIESPTNVWKLNSKHYEMRPCVCRFWMMYVTSPHHVPTYLTYAVVQQDLCNVYMTGFVCTTHFHIPSVHFVRWKLMETLLILFPCICPTFNFLPWLSLCSQSLSQSVILKAMSSTAMVSQAVTTKYIRVRASTHNL